MVFQKGAGGGLLACTGLSVFHPWIFLRPFYHEIFRHELSASTINLHYTLTDPEAFGIREGDPTFGVLNQESVRLELDYLKNAAQSFPAISSGD